MTLTSAALATPDRLHALDAVRAFALLSGIALHATMSFLPDLTSIGWPIADRSQSTTLEVAFYAIHAFRMMAFFLIAGFFAHLLFHRKGTRSFMKDRLARIGIPLLVGWPVLLASVGAIFFWAVKLQGGPSPSAPPPMSTGLPLIHLWFLYYLLLLYAIVLAARWAFIASIDRSGAMRMRIDGWLGVLMRGYWAPILLGAPLAASLYFKADWTWIGIPTPEYGLIPQLHAVVGFGTAFVLGWLLHRQIDLLQVWQRRWPVHLSIAAAATAASWFMMGQDHTFTRLVPDSIRAAYAATYVFAVWNWVFAIIGIALSVFSRASKVRRYLADSSYWLYLVHLPIVFALQVVVMRWNLHWTVKFPLILATTLALLLLSYHYLVRFTFVGRVLNGRKHPRAPNATDVIPAVEAPWDPDCVAALDGVHKRYEGTIALAGLDLQVRRGELLALLGPNGAGKSTAISLWLGLLRPDAGRVRLMGQSPERLTSRRAVGVMMQEVGLAAELRVREHIELVASYYPAPLTPQAAMELTGTSSLADRRYGKLSAGQKRQAQFAMAICGRPELLFLDEPTVGLDVQARESMWTAIRQLLKHGCSIVLTTHYLEEAEALADRVAVLAKGRLIASGTVNEMRALVSHTSIRCTSTLTVEFVRTLPGVVDVSRDQHKLKITAIDTEAAVRALLAADDQLRDLEVHHAGLAEAFAELTKEAA
jgi:ABC-type multidrug transport system ATPase subunit